MSEVQGPGPVQRRLNEQYCTVQVAKRLESREYRRTTRHVPEVPGESGNAKGKKTPRATFNLHSRAWLRGFLKCPPEFST
jgi:hypothetical protein